MYPKCQSTSGEIERKGMKKGVKKRCEIVRWAQVMVMGCMWCRVRCSRGCVLFKVDNDTGQPGGVVLSWPLGMEDIGE